MLSSFWHSLMKIIIWLMAVLKLSVAVSSVTFFTVFAYTLRIATSFSSVRCASIFTSVSGFWLVAQIFSRKRFTPMSPCVLHGFETVSGPMNISYMRTLSAPYCFIMSSGLMTFLSDLLIFATTRSSFSCVSLSSKMPLPGAVSTTWSTGTSDLFSRW